MTRRRALAICWFGVFLGLAFAALGVATYWQNKEIYRQTDDFAVALLSVDQLAKFEKLMPPEAAERMASALSASAASVSKFRDWLHVLEQRSLRKARKDIPFGLLMSSLFGSLAFGLRKSWHPAQGEQAP